MFIRELGQTRIHTNKHTEATKSIISPASRSIIRRVISCPGVDLWRMECKCHCNVCCCHLYSDKALIGRRGRVNKGKHSFNKWRDHSTLGGFCFTGGQSLVRVGSGEKKYSSSEKEYNS